MLRRRRYKCQPQRGYADSREVITPAHGQQADAVIELQLEKAGVRLAYLLNPNFILNAARL